MIQRNSYLIRKAFLSYITATVLAAMALSLGVVINGVIVGNLLGPAALSAVNLASPLVQLIAAVAMLINVGGATLTAISLGRGGIGDAGKIFTMSMLLSAVAGVLIFFLGLFFSDAVAGVLCSNAELFPLVAGYVKVVLLTAAAYIFLPGLAVFIRTDSAPKRATAALLTATATMVVLDFVFIGYLDMGVTGSALATAIGYTAGICVLLAHFRTPSPILALRRGGWEFVLPILVIGAPVALASGLMMVRLLGLNTLVLAALGTVGISIMSVCLNLMLLASMFIGGTAQTIQPIGGALYGLEDRRGVDMVIRVAAKFLIAALAVLVCVVFFFPQLFLTLFGLTGPELTTAAPALRIFSFSLILYGINYLLMIVYQVFGHRRLSTVIAVLQSLLVIVAAAVLIEINPNLIWFAFAAGELLVLCTIAVAVLIIRRQHADLKGLALQSPSPVPTFDVSLSGDGKDLGDLLDAVSAFLTEHNVSQPVTDRIRLSCEELVSNILVHGLKHDSRRYVDVLLRIEENGVVLIIRDDGAPFDPIEYNGDGIGLLLVRRMCSTLDYAFTMGQNTVSVLFHY